MLVKFFTRIISMLTGKSVVLFTIDNTGVIDIDSIGDLSQIFSSVSIIPIALLRGFKFTEDMNYIKKQELISKIIADTMRYSISNNIHVNFSSIKQELADNIEEEASR